MASYKDQYLKALRYLGELYPEAFLPEEDLAGISETIDYTRSKEGCQQQPKTDPLRQHPSA